MNPLSSNQTKTREDTLEPGVRFAAGRVIALLANFLLFEAAWFAAVVGGAAGWPAVGSLPAVAVVGLHLAFNWQRLGQELLIIAGVTLLGMVVETAFVAAGVISYAGSTPGSPLPPVWIIALWFAFGTLPQASLAWLKGRPTAQAVLGAIFGPLSYIAGESLGAAELAAPHALSIVLIGAGWAVALPLVFVIARLVSESGRD